MAPPQRPWRQAAGERFSGSPINTPRDVSECALGVAGWGSGGEDGMTGDGGGELAAGRGVSVRPGAGAGPGAGGGVRPSPVLFPPPACQWGGTQEEGVAHVRQGLSSSFSPSRSQLPPPAGAGNPSQEGVEHVRQRVSSFRPSRSHYTSKRTFNRRPQRAVHIQGTC